MKPSFFGSRWAFDAGAPHDGLLLEGKIGALTLTARIDGRLFQVGQLPDVNTYRYSDGAVTLRIDSLYHITREVDVALPVEPKPVDVGRILALLTLLRGISDSSHIHAVNAPLLAN
jgi:hypothetical protein